MIIKEPCRTAFLVVGMHRSGTSALAGTLGRLGLSVPADLMAASPANPNGYYESGELAWLHNRVLRSAGSRWDDWAPIAPSWFETPAANAHMGDIVRFLDRHFARAASFVVKDPRICRVMPLWRRALNAFGAKAHIVIPLRHPDCVARSLAARDGLLAGEANLLWLRHMLDAEHATRDLPRMFIGYDSLLADWRPAIAMMETRFDYRWPRSPDEAAADIQGFLDPRLRHHPTMSVGAGRDDRASKLAARGWHLFGHLTEQPEATATELDSLRGELDRIPSPRRLPLGLGTAASHVVHMIARLGSRFSPGQRLSEPGGASVRVAEGE